MEYASGYPDADACAPRLASGGENGIFGTSGLRHAKCIRGGGNTESEKAKTFRTARFFMQKLSG